MDSKSRPSDIALLDDYLSDPDLKPNVPWGFNIYRSDYSNDKAWQRMLHLIDETVRNGLEVNDAMDLYPRYKPVLVDNKETLEGATSHDIRDHFIAWVAEELPKVVSQPNEFFEREEFNSIGLRREWTLGTRYNFCLFVDDICIESLDEMRYPVVKLLWGQWGPLKPHERNYVIHPEYEDGETDEDDEDVGWTYMSVDDYMRYYNHLNEYDWWYNFYARPPYMVEQYGKIPGSWRKG
jgi:valyl-tRNA synthetase